MAAEQSSNCQLSDAIQNLPPELREKIYKDYVTIKLCQRAALGWNKVHKHILKLPLSLHAAACTYDNMLRLSGLPFRGTLFPVSKVRELFIKYC